MFGYGYSIPSFFVRSYDDNLFMVVRNDDGYPVVFAVYEDEETAQKHVDTLNRG